MFDQLEIQSSQIIEFLDRQQQDIKRKRVFSLLGAQSHLDADIKYKIALDLLKTPADKKQQLIDKAVQKYGIITATDYPQPYKRGGRFRDPVQLMKDAFRLAESGEVDSAPLQTNYNIWNNPEEDINKEMLKQRGSRLDDLLHKAHYMIENTNASQNSKALFSEIVCISTAYQHL